MKGVQISEKESNFFKNTHMGDREDVRKEGEIGLGKKTLESCEKESKKKKIKKKKKETKRKIKERVFEGEKRKVGYFIG